MANVPPQPWFFVDPKTGQIMAHNHYIDFLNNIQGEVVTTSLSVLNGVNQLANQLDAYRMAETPARIVGDASAGGAGDGTGTSASDVFSGKTSSGATWVSLIALNVTPTAPGGNYTVTISPDISILGSLSDEGPLETAFNGAWRLIEEDVGFTDTPVTKASGALTVTFLPGSTIDGEGGSVTVPSFWLVEFAGLPFSPVANTYDGNPTQLRLEIQRTSGTNEITAPGLSGAMSVAWNP